MAEPELPGRVIAWLAKVPFFRGDNPPDEQSASYDAWIEEGRGLNGVESELKRLLRTERVGVHRPQVAYALGWLGGPESVTALVEALRNSDLHLRIEAAAALGRLGDARAVSALGETLSADPDENVRANACESLRILGDRGALPWLRGALGDESPFVARLAGEAVAQLGGESESG